MDRSYTIYQSMIINGQDCSHDSFFSQHFFGHFFSSSLRHSCYWEWLIECIYAYHWFCNIRKGTTVLYMLKWQSFFRLTREKNGSVIERLEDHSILFRRFIRAPCSSKHLWPSNSYYIIHLVVVLHFFFFLSEDYTYTHVVRSITSHFAKKQQMKCIFW